MSRKPLAMGRFGFISLLICMLLSGKTQAQTVWLDSLYVRVADAKVLRPTGGDAVVTFDLEVFRPVKVWNNNDTTLGASDFVFGKEEMDLTGIFRDVHASPLHAGITLGTGGALKLESRFVLGKLQLSLTEVKGSSQSVALPYREWVKLCHVELPLKNPATVELGLVWDKTSTGLITKNIPILEVLMDDLEKIPDKLLTFEDYAASRTICSGEEFFLFAHAVSSGTSLKCTWQYSVNGGTTFTEIPYASDWGKAPGSAAFHYRTRGEHSDTLWLRGINSPLNGIIFKCVAEDPTVSTDKRETPDMQLNVLPEIKVALEDYTSLVDFEAGLGHSGDTVRRCPGESAKVRVAFYGIENVSQKNSLTGMGGRVYIAYSWIDQLGGDGNDTLKVNMSDIGTQSVAWSSGFVLTSDKLQLELEEDGKYYIHKVWTDSCSLGTVLTAYDTVVVRQSSNVVYEFDPIEYVAGSGGIDITQGLGINFTSKVVKSPAVGGILGDIYAADQVGTDTILYTYKSGGCEITATRVVHVVSTKSVAIKVLLEGPYIAKLDSMRCIHESYFSSIGESYISPYADRKRCPKPFPQFDRGIVDWIYVEVWDYPPNGIGFGDSKKGQLIDSTSALLLSDGTVAGVDGNKYISFEHLKENQYYVIIKHRNHMSVMSAEKVTFTGGSITEANRIDFTQKMEKAFDNAGAFSDQTPLKVINGKCLMYGGELNGDGLITGADSQIFFTQVFSIGYNTADISLDSQVNAVDQAFIEDNNGVYRKF